MIIDGMPHKIRSDIDNKEHWNWCCNNLAAGTWKSSFGFMSSSSSSYYFINAEDALAFALRFPDVYTPND